MPHPNPPYSPAGGGLHRRRDCVRCKFFLYVLTDPIIESSHDCEFAEWHIAYPALDAHFSAASLDHKEPNLFQKVYDFTKDAVLGGGAKHWTVGQAREQRTIEVAEVDSAPVNPLCPAAAGAAAEAEPAGAAMDSDGYTLVRPKRFALKSTPHPTVILECVVAEPVAAAGRHRLLIYTLEGLSSAADPAETAAALLAEMPQFTNASHDAALPQLKRLVTRLTSQLGGAADNSAAAGGAVKVAATTAPVLTREAKVAAIFEKFSGSGSVLKFADMNALVRATEGADASLNLESFEELCDFIKADAKKGLNLENLTNFFALGETDEDLNEAYDKIFPK